MNAPDQVVIGIDVGSTTVKMTVVDPSSKEILWSKYLRHETRQPEMTRDMLREIQEEATRQDRSLSWIVQKAWKIARNEIKKYPSVNEIPGDDDERGSKE